VKQLDLSAPIEVLRGIAPPMLNGKPMTFGDFLVQALQAESATYANGVKSMRIAIDIDRAMSSGSVELEDEDWNFVRDVARKDGRPAWAAWAVHQAFG